MVKKREICRLIIFSILITIFNLAKANELRKRIEPQGFNYGFGMLVNQELYRDYPLRIIPLPVIGYKSENLSIFGPFASYKVATLQDFSLTLHLQPRFAGFDEKDSPFFAGMKKRKFSMDGGISLTYKKNNWRIHLQGLADLLGRSSGYESDLKISKVFRLGPVFLEPHASLAYQDSRLTDYYYGVRKEEENNNLGRHYYHAGRALNPSVGLSIATPIFFNGLTRLQLTNTWYDKSLLNSPLTSSRSSGYTFIFTYGHFF